MITTSITSSWRRALLALATATLLGTSCQRELALPDTTVPDGQIVFGSEGLDLSVETKATEVTSLSSFYVSAVTGSAGSEASVWNSVQFSQVPGSSPASYAGNKYWPASNPGYKFYGSNVALNFAAGGTYVNASNATDVVCAYMPNPTYKGTNTLEFKHIFARITDVTFSSIDGYTISGISVTITPKTGGTYNLRTGNGQTNGTGWSSLTTGSATGIANATPGTKTNDLYLVPGTYTLTASWTATKGNYTKTFSNKTADIAMVGGCRNSITASLTGDASEVLFSVSVAAWGSNTIAVGMFPTNPAGSINGKFSVSATKQVYFAKGNLQATYGGSSWTWKFADHQWNYVGNAAANTSINGDGTVSSNGTVDLFGWVGASSTWTGLAMYGISNSTSLNSTSTYGNVDTESLKADWGSIPGVVSAYGDGWYTLSSDEWNYVLIDRTSGATVNGTPNARYTEATINTDGTSVNGVILFPDGVTIAAGEATTWGAINNTSDWATKCTSAQWSALESKGCVFLPAAGGRGGSSGGSGVGNVGSRGYYWSSTPYSGNVNHACNVIFYSGYMYPQHSNRRYYGFSVRLARDVN